MDTFGTLLYILLGIASFALVAFLAWATWNGGKKEGGDGRDDGAPPVQPGTPPAPPTETVAMTPEEMTEPVGRN